MTEAHATGKLLRNFAAFEANRAEVQFANTDFNDLVESAEFLESLFPSWVFILCKIQHAQISYVSDNCQAILGYSAGYIKSLPPEEYFGLVHPNDSKAVRLCFDYGYNWVKQNFPLDPKEYRFVLHYRLKTPKQGYVYLLDEKHSFRDKSGKYLHFSLIKNVTQQQSFTHVKLEIHKRSNSDYRKIDEYVPRTMNAHTITSREKEVLQCIQEGMTSKQIADRLSVSIFTVRNHRSNIFEKARAENMVQLIRYAQASGWI